MRHIPYWLIKSSEGMRHRPYWLIKSSEGMRHIPYWLIKSSEGMRYIPYWLIKSSEGMRHRPYWLIKSSEDMRHIPYWLIKSTEGMRHIPYWLIKSSEGMRHIPYWLIKSSVVHWSQRRFIITKWKLTHPCAHSPSVYRINGNCRMYERMVDLGLYCSQLDTFLELRRIIQTVIHAPIMEYLALDICICATRNLEIEDLSKLTIHQYWLHSLLCNMMIKGFSGHLNLSG